MADTGADAGISAKSADVSGSDTVLFSMANAAVGNIPQISKTASKAESTLV